jgi:hypothetical protein
VKSSWPIRHVRWVKMTGVSWTTSAPGIYFHNLNYVFYANIFNNAITCSLVFIVSLLSMGVVPIILWLLYPNHTDAYLEFNSFPRMYGRLPVKSHASTVNVTWSPMFTEVPGHFSSVSSMDRGIDTWKHL